MIIQIKSNNKLLADILYKNPNTDNGLYFAELKNGVVVGNIISENEYHILFQDKKYSYLPEESNAIDFQSYCSPAVILDIVSLLFGHILKEKQVFDAKEISWLNLTQGEADQIPCTIEVPNFYIYSSWYRNDNFLLSKYFSNVTVSKGQGRNHALTIKGENIFEAINLLSVIAVFTHVTNEYGIFTYIDDYFAQKYARILTNIKNVPYFVFYLFIRKTIKNEAQFLNVKEKFEQYLTQNGMDAHLTYHYLHQERVNFITSKINKNLPTLDVGCGEFIYYKSLRRSKYFEQYIGVDKDESFSTMAEKLVINYNDDLLEFHTTLENVNKAKEYNIIVSEVIEHNTVEEADKLLNEIKRFNFYQIVITTPNVEFNKYYDPLLEKRHDDHNFEMNRAEFKNFIASCFNESEFDVNFEYIGDRINDIYPTQAAIIKKIKL